MQYSSDGASYLSACASTAYAQKYKGVIVACETGGTLETSANFPFGKVSRSFKAIYRIMVESGASFDVKHLEAGVYGW